MEPVEIAGQGSGMINFGIIALVIGLCAIVAAAMLTTINPRGKVIVASVGVAAGLLGIGALAFGPGPAVQVDRDSITQAFPFIEDDGYEFYGIRQGQYVWQNRDFERIVTATDKDNLIYPDDVELSIARQLRADRDPQDVLKDNGITPKQPTEWNGLDTGPTIGEDLEMWKQRFSEADLALPENMEQVRERLGELREYATKHVIGGLDALSELLKKTTGN